FLQTPMTDPQEVWDAIPANAQEIVRKKHIQVVALDTKAIALEEAPSPQYNQVMQGVVLLGIFLSKVPFLQGLNMAEEELFDQVYKVLDKNYGHRPESLRANLNCVKRGYHEVFEIPRGIIEITSIVRSLPLAEN
ncbi:MAG: pyruvate ferredoxin oxidoreductase, partial [Candidatus Poribacteria bacterium]|nr:pyruvate ferredoxin oxidoreductase [Candidatus Poribacteria bacterium]